VIGKGKRRDDRLVLGFIVLALMASLSHLAMKIAQRGTSPHFHWKISALEVMKKRMTGFN
jgi:hypothetical protein